MPQPRLIHERALTAPTFYLTGRQSIRPGVILLAFAVALACAGLIVYALNHARQMRLAGGGPDRAGGASGSSSKDDDDDPNQVDTIVLGDPTEAPVPGTHGNHVSSVHPTIVVRLPRSGETVGLIPNTAAGQLLYAWLSAFNVASPSGLAAALPNAAPDSAIAAEMELRQQTGGFRLISAKEVQPGLLVFRLRDQTPLGTEVLGTLQVRVDSSPAAIASFSLRAVAAQLAAKGAARGAESSPR